MSRDRCAGDVIIIEVNRPPTPDSARSDIVTETPRSRNDVIGESPRGGVTSRLEHAEGPCDVDTRDSAGRCGRRGNEEGLYVELDVDCASAGRRNVVTPSRYDANFIRNLTNY